MLKSKATALLQGTILTDIEETAAGIKRQHNVFEQIGIDPKKAFGYKISEPLIELRKDGVRRRASPWGSRSRSSAGALYDTIGWATHTYYHNERAIGTLARRAMSNDSPGRRRPAGTRNSIGWP